jgi:transcriptional regulator with XRE-family HTH domain
MSLHIKTPRLGRLPDDMRRALVAARQQRGWSQVELGRRVGLPQVHISGIETGKVVPRFDTLLDLVRVLGYDLLLVPRSLAPAAQALIRDSRDQSGSQLDDEERPLYASNGAEEAGRDES